LTSGEVPSSVLKYSRNDLRVRDSFDRKVTSSPISSQSGGNFRSSAIVPRIIGLRGASSGSCHKHGPIESDWGLRVRHRWPGNGELTQNPVFREQRPRSVIVGGGITSQPAHALWKGISFRGNERCRRNRLLNNPQPPLLQSIHGLDSLIPLGICLQSSLLWRNEVWLSRCYICLLRCSR
jgi:hypothetical protein